MTKPDARVVELTREHLLMWDKERGAGPTVKGVAGFIGDELVAVAGLLYIGGNVIAFCDLKPEARQHKHLMHRVAIQIIADAKKHHKRIIARCDEKEATAPTWLARLGFTHEEGNIWAWQTSD